MRRKKQNNWVPKVHYLARHGSTLCSVDSTNTTEDQEQVTCGICRKKLGLKVEPKRKTHLHVTGRFFTNGEEFDQGLACGSPHGTAVAWYTGGHDRQGQEYIAPQLKGDVYDVTCKRCLDSAEYHHARDFYRLHNTTEFGRFFKGPNTKLLVHISGSRGETGLIVGDTVYCGYERPFAVYRMTPNALPQKLEDPDRRWWSDLDKERWLKLLPKIKKVHICPDCMSEYEEEQKERLETFHREKKEQARLKAERRKLEKHREEVRKQYIETAFLQCLEDRDALLLLVERDAEQMSGSELDEWERIQKEMEEGERC